MYKKDNEKLSKLKERIIFAKKRKRRIEIEPLSDFQLISDDEDN